MTPSALLNTMIPLPLLQSLLHEISYRMMKAQMVLQVAVAAVIGMPHEKWTERPLLVVQSRDSAAPPSSDEMRQFLKVRDRAS